MLWENKDWLVVQKIAKKSSESWELKEILRDLLEIIKANRIFAPSLPFFVREIVLPVEENRLINGTSDFICLQWRTCGHWCRLNVLRRIFRLWFGAQTNLKMDIICFLNS